jgi:putative transposase
MANNSMTAIGLFDKVVQENHGDLLREAVKRVLQEMMSEEVTALIGAAPHERTEERKGYRNGSRSRILKTRVGEVDLAIPKLREGNYFPSFLTPRRPWEQALVSVIQESYINGVSTRKVDRLVEAMGIESCSKDTVSRLCRELDEAGEAFRNRPLDGAFPYVWFDARYEKVRENGRVRSMALVIAYGVNTEGHRSVLGLDVDVAETQEGWVAFLKKLRARGLSGVQLVISDAFEGLKAAIAQVFPEASWQRCKVHLLRNILARVPRSARPMVSAMVRMVFLESNLELAKERLRQVADQLRERFPDAAQLLEDAEEDVLAFTHFPFSHWSKLCSTNPLERLNREIARRTDVVSIFPNRASLLRLATAYLQEQDEEWLTERRYMSLGSLSEVATDALAPVSGKFIA